MSSSVECICGSLGCLSLAHDAVEEAAADTNVGNTGDDGPADNSSAKRRERCEKVKARALRALRVCFLMTDLADVALDLTFAASLARMGERGHAALVATMTCVSLVIMGFLRLLFEQRKGDASRKKLEYRLQIFFLFELWVFLFEDATSLFTYLQVPEAFDPGDVFSVCNLLASLISALGVALGTFMGLNVVKKAEISVVLFNHGHIWDGFANIFRNLYNTCEFFVVVFFFVVGINNVWLQNQLSRQLEIVTTTVYVLGIVAPFRFFCELFCFRTCCPHYPQRDSDLRELIHQFTVSLPNGQMPALLLGSGSSSSTVVKVVLKSSPLVGKVQPDDRVLTVNNVDVCRGDPIDFLRALKDKGENILTFITSRGSEGDDNCDSHRGTFIAGGKNLYTATLPPGEHLVFEHAGSVVTRIHLSAQGIIFPYDRVVAVDSEDVSYMAAADVRAVFKNKIATEKELLVVTNRTLDQAVEDCDFAQFTETGTHGGDNGDVAERQSGSSDSDSSVGSDSETEGGISTVVNPSDLLLPSYDNESYSGGGRNADCSCSRTALTWTSEVGTTATMYKKGVRAEKRFVANVDVVPL